MKTQLVCVMRRYFMMFIEDSDFYRTFDVSVRVTAYLFAVHAVLIYNSSFGASFSAVILVQCVCH